MMSREEDTVGAQGRDVLINKGILTDGKHPNQDPPHGPEPTPHTNELRLHLTIAPLGSKHQQPKQPLLAFGLLPKHPHTHRPRPNTQQCRVWAPRGFSQGFNQPQRLFDQLVPTSTGPTPSCAYPKGCTYHLVPPLDLMVSPFKDRNWA